MPPTTALGRLGLIAGAAVALFALGFAGWRVEGFGPRGDTLVSVSRPRYSLLHLRAAVAVGDYYGWEGGDGHVCRFWRGLAGWRLQSCRRTWIA